VQVYSAIGREFTLATNQVDFAIPPKFNLAFRNAQNDLETHPSASIALHWEHMSGFIGFLIEHYAGNFPLWLSPKQVSILPISEKYNAYAKKFRGY